MSHWFGFSLNSVAISNVLRRGEYKTMNRELIERRCVCPFISRSMWPFLDSFYFPSFSYKVQFPHTVLSLAGGTRGGRNNKKKKDLNLVTSGPAAKIPKRMKNKFIGGKCQVGSCERDFGGLTRHNYRPAPHRGPGCGIFMLVVSQVSPQRRGTPLFDPCGGGLCDASLFLFFSLPDIVWEWMSGQSQQRASPSRNTLPMHTSIKMCKPAERRAFCLLLMISAREDTLWITVKRPHRARVTRLPTIIWYRM